MNAALAVVWPVPPLAIGSVPVTPVASGKPVAFVSVIDGPVANTMLPEPVVVLPSAVTVPLVGTVSVVVPVNVKVELYAPDVMKVEPSASVSVAPVAGAVNVILLIDPFRTKLPLLSTTKEAVEAPVTVKFSRFDDADEPELVTANLMPFQVVAASFHVSLRL